MAAKRQLHHLARGQIVGNLHPCNLVLETHLCMRYQRVSDCDPKNASACGRLRSRRPQLELPVAGVARRKYSTLSNPYQLGMSAQQ